MQGYYWRNFSNINHIHFSVWIQPEREVQKFKKKKKERDKHTTQISKNDMKDVVEVCDFYNIQPPNMSSVGP